MMMNPSKVFSSLGVAAVLALVCVMVLSFPTPAAAQGTCNVACSPSPPGGTRCSGTVAMFGCPSPGIMNLMATSINCLTGNTMTATGATVLTGGNTFMAYRVGVPGDGLRPYCTIVFAGSCAVAPFTRTATCSFGPPEFPVELMEFSIEPEPEDTDDE